MPEKSYSPPAADYQMFSRWDALNPTNLHAALLCSFAFVVWHRPHLPELLPSYAAFDDLMPWHTWGWAALGIALALLFTPRSGIWRLAAHALSGTFWLAAAVSFGASSGLTFYVTACALLAVSSTVLFSRTAVNWQRRKPWWRNLVARPPRWLRRLASVDEFKPGKRRG